MILESTFLVLVLLYSAGFIIYLLRRIEDLKYELKNPPPHTHSIWIKFKEGDWHSIITSTDGNILIDDGNTEYSIASITNYNKRLKRKEWLQLYNSGMPVGFEELIRVEDCEIHFGNIYPASEANLNGTNQYFGTADFLSEEK